MATGKVVSIMWEIKKNYWFFFFYYYYLDINDLRGKNNRSTC